MEEIKNDMDKRAVEAVKNAMKQQQERRKKVLEDLNVLLIKIEELKKEWEELKEDAPNEIKRMMKAFEKEALSSDE